MLIEAWPLKIEASQSVSFTGTFVDGALATRADGTPYKWVAVTATGDNKVGLRFDRNSGALGIISGHQAHAGDGRDPLIFNIQHYSHYHAIIEAGASTILMFAYLDWQ